MNTPLALPTQPSPVARLLATEVLLANPEAREDDVLESCLYILLDKLRDADPKAKHR